MTLAHGGQKWWQQQTCGASTAAPDPRGCLLQITAAHGRLQGRTALIPAMSDLRFRDLTAEQRAAAMLASLKTQPPVLELFIRTGAPPSALDSSVDAAEPPAAAAAVSATQFATRPVLVVDPLREDGGSPFMPLAARDGEGGAGMSVQIMIDAPEVGDGTADGELPPSALEDAAEPPVPDDDILSVLQEQLAAAAAPPQEPPSDDAASGATCRALLDVGVPASSILVPNPLPHVVARLRRELGVTAFAATVEDWLATEPSGTLLSAVYLDHTRSLGDGLLAQLRELASPARTGPGAVLAATFSTRSPVAGAAWSRARALHTYFSTLSSAAAARGLTIAGCGDAWPEPCRSKH